MQGPGGFVGGSSPSKFTELTDCPDSYIGQSGKYPRVKSTENGLEFVVFSQIDQFSYEFIEPLKNITIPLYQQMLVYDNIEIEGDLSIEGTLVVLE